MTDHMKRHFMNVLFKVKKIDVCQNSDLSLPLSEMAVLTRLLSNNCSGGNCMNMSDIHHDLYISKPAVSQTLNSLERKGYIQRYIDKNDRRKIMVTATVKAYDVLKESEAAVDAKINKIMDEFGEENMLILINQLATFYEIYERISKE